MGKENHTEGKRGPKPGRRRGGFPAYIKPLVDARGPRPLALTSLAAIYGVPTYAVEEWLKEWMKEEPGSIVTWKRRNCNGEMKAYYRVPLDVAARIGLKHGVGGKRLTDATNKILRAEGHAPVGV